MRRVLLVVVIGLVALSTSSCTLYGWGDNTLGQIGDGTRESRSEPVPAARNPNWVLVDAGDSHSCGIDITRAMYCWGNGEVGQLGDGVGYYVRTIPTRVGTANDWIAVSAGGFAGSLPFDDQRTGHTCGIRQPGALYCWGRGPIGSGTGPEYSPVQVGTATDWTRVSAGAFHSCGIRGGELYCWGSNTRGQLGDGTLTGHPTPVRIGTASDWNEVSASFAAHTCGIRAGGQLYCWGENGNGQLGDGTTIDRTVPTRVGAAADWKQVSTAGTGTYYGGPVPEEDNIYTGHSCGIRAGSELYCWGINAKGQLGGTRTTRLTPIRESTNSVWKTLTTGPGLTCGIQGAQGYLFCWGAGALGDGETVSSLVPKQALFDKWYSVSAGRAHVSALRAGNDTV